MTNEQIIVALNSIEATDRAAIERFIACCVKLREVRAALESKNEDTVAESSNVDSWGTISLGRRGLEVQEASDHQLYSMCAVYRCRNNAIGGRPYCGKHRREIEAGAQLVMKAR